MRAKCEKGDPVCRCCGESIETLEHMFFMCSNARAIWKAAPLSWEGLEVFNKSFWHWWEELRGATGRDTVVDKVVLEWNEYQLAQDAGIVEEGNSAGKVGATRGWEKPQDNWIKINTDAALNMKRGKAGWGIVARDRHERVIRSWACPTTCCADAKVEEALVIREAMGLARREGWRKVEFESDCKLVVDKINAYEEESSIAIILADIWSLRTKFDKCCFSFTRGSNNSVSHQLAKFAIDLKDIAEWKCDFPAWLLELAQADLKEDRL
ncbi:uncharacterized protein [Coffea arabica]|uniref:RNase H type-1 domain-containing protein n=1 Tax=Coffea arabica TaxID=13443 RepID=A0A6P6VB32_COFAR|nr:uncharacterized protein LOC113718474 [Coffea arabica]